VTSGPHSHLGRATGPAPRGQPSGRRRAHAPTGALPDERCALRRARGPVPSSSRATTATRSQTSGSSSSGGHGAPTSSSTPMGRTSRAPGRSWCLAPRAPRPVIMNADGSGSLAPPPAASCSEGGRPHARALGQIVDKLIALSTGAGLGRCRSVIPRYGSVFPAHRGVGGRATSCQSRSRQESVDDD